ncbi:MAG TPA: response regulator transcription factor [Gemmatimonadales bacterium]|nr:response regulator transcription factor [Gemmatimonadales bacterium]
MRILVVEDERALAESLAKGLRQAAHAVDLAESLAAAREKLALETYDALVLDLGLPDGSGLSLARELRARRVQLPILMLTARDTVADRVHGLDAGADDYVVKPFALEEVLARLRALERRAPEVRAGDIVVADLRVDPATRSAERAGEPIALTTTEYALLEYLARHAGTVLGRAEISAHVWDENYDPLSNVIDVYVARLRRKVDRPGLVPMLHTVRGAGYTLDPARAGA